MIIIGPQLPTLEGRMLIPTYGTEEGSSLETGWNPDECSTVR